ncbi:hypothetical protein F4805DRAFT_437060 [Annulohypoxylon moriforme]|nr:hypothetical protein F4805DRAFT_437060 [Annulohypoxylon moriforme]
MQSISWEMIAKDESITCRRRRVNCDELKPNFGRCIKSMQKCLYALPQRGSTTGERD